MITEFQIKVRESLLLAAKDYLSLVSEIVVFESDKFVVQKRYVLKFTKGNFLHLTGLSSTLSAAEFFEKCLDGSISFDDFYLDLQRTKSTIKKKLKNLVNLSEMFNEKVLIQESFIRNRIVCKIATSDGKRTLGFIDGHYCLYPNTLLDKNHLDLSKPILNVMPIKITEN